MNGLAEFKRPVAVSKRQENAKGWLIMGSAQAGMAWHGMAFVLDCSSAYFSATGSLLHSEPTHYWAKKPSPPLQARPRPPVYVLALCLRSRSSCDDCTCRRRVKFDANSMQPWDPSRWPFLCALTVNLTAAEACICRRRHERRADKKRQDHKSDHGTCIHTDRLTQWVIDGPDSSVSRASQRLCPRSAQQPQAPSRRQSAQIISVWKPRARARAQAQAQLTFQKQQRFIIHR